MAEPTPDVITAPTTSYNPEAVAQEQAAQYAKGANKTLNDANVNPVRTSAAKKKAMAHLRHANKHHNTFEMTVVGNLDYIAGNCVNIDSTFGKFAGKYILDKISHRIARNGAGYQCSITGHLCLEGY